MRKITQIFGVLALVAALSVNAYAATISFTVPDAIVPELTAAMQARYGRLGGETDAQLVRRVTRDHFWKVLVDDARRIAAQQTATQTAADAFGTN
jgi:hypothetical protein